MLLPVGLKRCLILSFWQKKGSEVLWRQFQITMSLEKKVILNIKLTASEKEQLKRDAHAHGMNTSEYVRFLIEQERENQASE